MLATNGNQRYQRFSFQRSFRLCLRRRNRVCEGENVIATHSVDDDDDDYIVVYADLSTFAHKTIIVQLTD